MPGKDVPRLNDYVSILFKDLGFAITLVIRSLVGTIGVFNEGGDDIYVETCILKLDLGDVQTGAGRFIQHSNTSANVETKWNNICTCTMYLYVHCAYALLTLTLVTYRYR